ncbi:MAG: TetR family transcriptional regulator C-terminal domain-containing protein [Pseudomonadota bacterium]
MSERKITRIQLENKAKILSAATKVFAHDGFRGATVDAIAKVAGMSKPNLLYYFPSKEAIYRDLLEDLLDAWLDPLREMNPRGEPTHEITAYIQRKIELARDYPTESRLFAGEMLRGAPILNDILGGGLKAMVDEKAEILRQWSAEGKIARIDPYHLIFAIWATTQHYADFDAQVRAVLGDEGEGRFHDAATALTQIFLYGLKPR